MAKKTSNLKTVDDTISARRQEIEATLAEMVDTIEKYFLITPFDFIEGTEGEGTYHLFSNHKHKTPFIRFPEWVDNWLCALFPRAYQTQAKLEKQDTYTDETSELAYDVHRLGFITGVLVGMKAMGASKEELHRRAQGFVIPTIEHQRWSIESDAAKADK
jgi:hypothetical protein